jgi:multidrug efflux system membrane fusion protein
MNRLRSVIVVVLPAVAGLILWHWAGKSDVQASAAPPSPAAVPVDVDVVTRRDVPDYRTGLGTVQAFNTVTVTARVDGQLQKVEFVEGQEVKKGDVLVQIDPRPYQAQLEQTIGKEGQDEAQLANAQKDLERYSTLAAMDYTSKQTLDTTRAQVAQLTALVKSDQAAIANARTQLEYTTITSPIEGRTGIRLIYIGNNVHASDTTGIVVITQLHPISVILSLPEDMLPELSRAMKAGPVTVSALPRNDTKELDRGTVALIDNEIDQSTGTMRLKAIFPNRESTLWPGAYVNARLLLKTEKRVLTIPSAAVQRGPDGLYVYVVKPGETVQTKPIKIAEDTGEIAVIDDGLVEGEHIVTAGQYRLKPGTHVQTQAAGKIAPAPDSKSVAVQ